MSTRGNDAELRVLLLNWCRKKSDLWIVESYVCKLQYKFCSVTFLQICFFCTTISAERGMLEQITKQILRKRSDCFHICVHKSTSEQFLGISLCNKCEEPPSSSAGNWLVWLMCSGKKTILLLWKLPWCYPGFQDFLKGISALLKNNTQLSKLLVYPESFVSIG